MSELKELPLASIEVGDDRARPLDEGWAANLAVNIEMQGLLSPVLVREVDGGHRLIDGWHRLKAHEILGLDKIMVKVSDAMSDDMARLAELSANLATKLVALDKCHHFHDLKQVWLRLHPEFRRGGERGNQYTGGKRQSLPFATSDDDSRDFEAATSERFSYAGRTVREFVEIWDGLSKDSRKDLHGTDLATKKTELKALSKLSAKRQGEVLDAIFREDLPDVGNVAQALEYLDGGIAPDPLEKRFTAVSKLIAGLDDVIFNRVISVHEERIIASLRRRGRI